MRSRQSIYRQAGFTLIEVMSVVAIISLLISILMPSLAGAREASRRAVCASNQRQLAIAATAYTSASQDWMNPLEDFVRPPPEFAGQEVEITFRVLLTRYTGRNPSLFDCPTETKAVYADGLTSSDIFYMGTTGIGVDPDPKLYGKAHPFERWNASGIGIAGVHWISIKDPDWQKKVCTMPFGRTFESGYREGLKKYSQIKSPSKLIWFADGGSGTTELWGDDNWWIKQTDKPKLQDPGYNRLKQNDYGCTRHNGQANYAFADGHVALFEPNNIRCNTNECWWSIRPDTHR